MIDKTYKILEGGDIQDIETGTVYPPRRGTHLANMVIDQLVTAGVASEDEYGQLGFHPDGKILVMEVPVTPTKTKKSKV